MVPILIFFQSLSGGLSCQHGIKPDDSAPNSKEFTLHMWREDRELRQNGRNFTFFSSEFLCKCTPEVTYVCYKFSVLKGFKQSAGEVGHYSSSLEC